MSQNFKRSSKRIHLDELQGDFYEKCRESYFAHKNYGQFKSEEFRQKAEEAWDKCVDRYSIVTEEIHKLQELHPEEKAFLEGEQAYNCKRFHGAKEQHDDLFVSAAENEDSDSSPSEDDDDLVSISSEEPEEKSILGAVSKSITGLLETVSQFITEAKEEARPKTAEEIKKSPGRAELSQRPQEPLQSILGAGRSCPSQV